jgi:hypothetical protein
VYVVCGAREKNEFCGEFCDAMSQMRSKRATIEQEGANEQLSGNSGLDVKCALSLSPVLF